MSAKETAQLSVKAPGKLFFRSLPALHAHSPPQHLVLLHGWGVDSKVWSEILPQLREHFSITLIDLPGFGGSAGVVLSTLEQWLAAIMAVAPARGIYLGFSLGGMLAVQLGSRFPQRVSAVITIASNASFVANEQWLPAMPAQNFEDFYQLTQGQPAMALKRFAALQAKGCDGERELLKALKSITVETSAEGLGNGLLILAAIDNRSALAASDLPSLHIYGEHDSLVPVAAAAVIDGLACGKVTVIDGASHVPFISHRESCYAMIKDFLQAENLLPVALSPRKLDKRQVARSFSRAAESYDAMAVLQRQVGDALFNSVADSAAQITVDLGCGTGFYLPALQRKLGGEVIAFDLAEGMARYVKQGDNTRSCLCADAEAMPLADSSVDVIFSSLAIQWCEDNRALFAEVQRVLKPGGKMFFSTLGPETLFELRQAWSTVDDYVHVNRFVEREVLEQAAKAAGFATLLLREDMITLEYAQLKQLTRELKGIGAHNINEGRPAGLTGRQRIKQLLAAYESQRNERALLPATYQVWYGELHK